jgi:hypothetical protein
MVPIEVQCTLEVDSRATNTTSKKNGNASIDQPSISYSRNAGTSAWMFLGVIILSNATKN